jgi:hypothetical protein
MWLVVSLSIVGLGLVLLAIAGLSTWMRWQKVRRAGGRFGTRVGSLSASAGLLADRLQTDDRLRPND